MRVGARSRRSSPSARTSSRTGCSPPASRSRARRCRCGTRRPSSRCCPSYADREELGEIQAAASAKFNRRPARAARRRARSSPPSSPGSPTPVERNEEEKGISLRELSRALKQASDDSTDALRRAARALVREAARRRARRRSRRATTPRTCAGSRRSSRRTRRTARPRSASQTLDGARLRPRRADEHQARPRRPAAEVAARLRDRERPAEGRAPDHARAGRPARLPGVPARGRSRAALRRLRPDAPVHLPPHLARPRADGDLLVHRRGDLARARVARALLRPLATSRRARTPRRRRSSRRCSTAATRRSCATSSTSGRASASDGGDARRLRGAPDRGDRHPLPHATTTSPTWTPASTRPTTCARGSARRSCAST